MSLACHLVSVGGGHSYTLSLLTYVFGTRRSVSLACHLRVAGPPLATLNPPSNAFSAFLALRILKSSSWRVQVVVGMPKTTEGKVPGVERIATMPSIVHPDCM